MPTRKSYATKRKPVARRKAYSKRAPMRRARTFDGRNLLVTQYLEVEETGTTARNLGYAIACDPSNMLIHGARAADNTAGSLGMKVQDGAGNYKSVNEPIPALLFNREKSMWRLFRVNRVTVKVTADARCGENPLIFLTDKGNSTVPTNYAQCMAQAHKSHIITEQRRQVQYGHTSSGTQEKEWVTSFPAADINHIKVFQALEAPPAGVTATCIHRIEVMFDCTFKDSITPGALN